MEEHVLDLLPGYALGSLDDDELIKVAQHLPGCALCQTELEGYRHTADQLALALPVMEPPQRLKASMMDKINQKAQGSRFQPEATAKPTWRDRLAAVLRPAALGWALVAVLLLVLAVNNYLLWQRVNELQTQIPPGNVQVVDLSGTNTAPQAIGYLMVFPNRDYGTLVVENAPLLEMGTAYQLWLIRDGERYSGGTFTVDEDGYGVLEVYTHYPLNSFHSFGVTVEPEEGSEYPTGDKVLGGDL